MRERDTRLTNDERHKLEVMEAALALEDPDLNRCLRYLTVLPLTASTERKPFWRSPRTSLALFIALVTAATVAMTIGVLFVMPLLSMAGVLLLTTGLVLRTLPRCRDW